MLFNSLTFALFLPIVFTLYWFVFQRNLKVQNLFIVVASFVFYGWWDWRFLSLILISIEPTKDFMAFAAFVSFFPLLVAVPIERAKNLLPQFFVKRSFDYRKAVDGMRQILCLP